jgi:hypothetical protein
MDTSMAPLGRENCGGEANQALCQLLSPEETRREAGREGQKRGQRREAREREEKRTGGKKRGGRGESGRRQREGQDHNSHKVGSRGEVCTEGQRDTLL